MNTLELAPSDFLWQSLITFDRFLTFFFIQSPHPLILELLFSFFSAQGVYIMIWFSIFLYLIFFEEKKQKTFIIYFLASLIIAFLSVTIIKNLTKRPRPFSANYNQLQPITTNYSKDYSFPSGHATISFSVATILSAFNKKRRKYFYSIAVLIAFSRIYLGYHYVTDVIVGSLLGWLISWTLSLKLKMKNTTVKRKSNA